MDPIARTTKQVGTAIRRYRRQKSLTQADLGELMKARQATVSKLEGGQPTTQLTTLINALTALDLELTIRPRSKASTTDLESLF